MAKSIIKNLNFKIVLQRYVISKSIYYSRIVRYHIVVLRVPLVDQCLN